MARIVTTQAGGNTPPVTRALDHLEVARRCAQAATDYPEAARGLTRAAAHHADKAQAILLEVRRQHRARR